MQSVTQSWAPELAMPNLERCFFERKIKDLIPDRKNIYISKVTRCYLPYYLLVYLLFF